MGMIETCPKCGSGWIRPLYEPVDNRLRFTCPCGYSWTEPALDTKVKP